ncbi:hypothetical protein [Geobacillus subterraneus]|uniref:hypothetical protein n=1 Tax=Geobacillus subterraneus TaxID=129338 RepID=UPI001620DED5
MSLLRWLVWLGCAILLVTPAIGRPAATAATPHASSAAGLLEVKHEVKGNDVFIECFAAQFPFHKGNGGGHINVYINGQKMTEVYTAAFIVRGLPNGKHVIRLELAYNDGKMTGMAHEFDVEIP